MHVSLAPAPRCLAAALVAAGLWLGATPARADTPPGERNADAGKAGTVSRETRRDDRRAGAREGEEAMDRLRERLAEKLGAARLTDPHVMRLNVQSPVPSAAKSSAAASRKPRAAAKAGPSGPWAYEGDAGPHHWGRLKPEFAKCSNGSRQSPIDIRDGIKVDLEALRFDYKPTAFRVIDNGRTVQVNLAPGNTIEVAGRRYGLLQFHFHRPSEERVDGRQFDMDVHLVHKDPEGRIAVVAVLLERGSAQPVVQSVWNNLPLEKGEEVPARTLLDLDALLPAQRGYFTYIGSLTTPPCSEGVLWMVMKQPVAVSPEQVAIFERFYPMNARPIQSASGRLIKESN
jgi:carbonic anhydrase